MHRVSILFLLLLLGTGTVLLSTNGCGGGITESHVLAGKFRHIVIIFQENRTPDNLFHDPVLMKEGADIATSGINSSGKTVAFKPIPLAIPYDLDHSHKAFEAMYNGGKMNGASNVAVICYNTPNCPSSQPNFLYVRPKDVEPYFQMAEEYTFGDRMFQTNEGPSFPAHQFIVSGTSAPSPGSSSFLADNALGQDGIANTGCTSPPSEKVLAVTANGSQFFMYPCTDHPTLTDELNRKRISWKYYTPTAGLLWTAPNAIQHMCGPNAPPPNATACVGPDWTQHVVLYTSGDHAPILSDIANSQLPEVSWVMPSAQNSDHAGMAIGRGGPSWVAAIVNAIGKSQYWGDTAIFVTWDDWGGWYDHVPPFKVVNDGVSWGSGYVYGFRVPLIVISPYARPQYVSHINHDFGSILHLIEENYNLPSLGFADSYADDLSDCFNFQQQPLTFRMINAPLKADHFIHDTTPPMGPDDD
ncbi:MAG TPA: alkaline phosphatase family protein [Candidatus Eisenbacteria bacterium]|nr:alkaline phosphatase family protein [Candidatus Eisenbacteria bacterium]